jgi:hypothetical protein
VPDIRRMTGPLRRAAVQRVEGETPGAFRAIVGATVGGAATGVLIYKLLRQ